MRKGKKKEGIRAKKKKKKIMREIKPWSCNCVIKLGAERGFPSGLCCFQKLFRTLWGAGN